MREIDIKNLILVKHSFVNIPTAKSGKCSTRVLGTVISNLAYYGFCLSKEAFTKLQNSTDETVINWWKDYEPAFRKVTGDDKDMGKYVVYKNFPKECLEMSGAEYWIKQILMYWGLPNELFTQEEVKRDTLFEKTELKVLQLSEDMGVTLESIYNTLLKLPSRWTPDQLEQVQLLSQLFTGDLNSIPFKENMVVIAATFIKQGIPFILNSATDVLRLATHLSDGDITLKTNTKFKSFNRKTRKTLLSLLNSTSNLCEDMARDKNRWKKFIKNLHPGDYPKLKNVTKAYDMLYKDQVKSVNSEIESGILSKNDKVLKILKDRPGEFMRRLSHVIDRFGLKAVNAFTEVLPKLKTIQLLKIKRFLETDKTRKFRTIPPKGNWTKLKVLEKTRKIKHAYRTDLVQAIKLELQNRLSEKFPFGIVLDDKTDLIKLQTNDSELAPFGRGTTFEIPENVKFIRTASYWEHSVGYGNTWFDNGWNFFDENWNPVGACCWDINTFPYKTQNVIGAIFSGDPTNSKDLKGKACQMIDLYPEELRKNGVRYAVWNILCYSRIKFSEAKDVFGALQWGEEKQSGKLFEPSRCQLSFQLTGDTYTKYVAYIDLLENKLVYIDANLKSNTSSTASNGPILKGLMPAFVEYLETLPSVYDLFENNQIAKNTQSTIVTYSDEKKNISGDAYVFKSVNQKNKFKQLDISKYL